MKLSRAIELLTNPLNLEAVKRYTEFTAAIKLGAEALKRIRKEREMGGLYNYDLPSETPE